MKKTYWVKKNPKDAAGWIEMDGKQFFEFINSSAGNGRYFMDCDSYEIEVTKEQYHEWKRETNHSDYLRKYEDEVEVLSLDYEYLNMDNDIFGDGFLIDEHANTENEVIWVIDMELLADALRSLTDDERWLINELFLRDKPKTEDEIAAITGKTRQAVNKQKKKILKKLKMLVANS